MLAVQRPPSHFFSSVVSRPNHCRHPSAPVVVRPTHTPGLLSLSKPPPRPQQSQQPRQQRSSPKEDAKKAVSAPKTDTPSEKPKPVTATTSTPDKSARGRQSAKDKAHQRNTSLSTSRGNARRPLHQPSPPPSTRIPSQAEVSSHPRKLASAEPSRFPQHTLNLFDPFVVTTSNNPRKMVPKDSGLSKAGSIVPNFHSPPRLASHPTGKLARRRQLTSVPSTPTPSKAVPVPRHKARERDLLSRSEPALIPMVLRPKDTPVSTSLPDWDSFPVCDDSSDMADDSDDTPPTTPIRELASVPAKKGAAWQRNDTFGDAPHTAPFSSTFGFPFRQSSPDRIATPTHRRRVHRRVPSDGVFHMSMDEDSSASESLEPHRRSPIVLPKRRAQSAAEHRPADAAISSSPEAAFFAGSMFQNSPSPDDLPVPSFHP
ncbi:hypothetical protein BKA93DRAFT_152027 [Sparassis latifolia]